MTQDSKSYTLRTVKKAQLFDPRMVWVNTTKNITIDMLERAGKI